MLMHEFLQKMIFYILPNFIALIFYSQKNKEDFLFSKNNNNF